jgi:hypothetical protein
VFLPVAPKINYDLNDKAVQPMHCEIRDHTGAKREASRRRRVND